MPLSPEVLTTLDQVKQQLGISGTDEDALLESYIEAATAAVETYCRRRFAYAEGISETFPAYGTEKLFLRRPPVASVAEVNMDGAILQPETYAVDAALGIITLLQPVSVSQSSTYTVSYTGGFVTPEQADQSGGALARTLPRDVELAAILATVALYRSGARDPNVTRESLLSASQAFGNGWFVLSPAAQALLAPWRLA